MPVCKFCSKPFQHKSSLSRHIKALHNNQTENGSIQCNECNSRYYSTDENTLCNIYYLYLYYIANRFLTVVWSGFVTMWSPSSRTYAMGECVGAYVLSLLSY